MKIDTIIIVTPLPKSAYGLTHTWNPG